MGSRLGSAEAGARLTSADLFVAQMNALAKQLKMERTRFVNPHGMDYKVKPLPYSTAEDMARLTRYAMSKPSFRFYVSQKERQISSIAQVSSSITCFAIPMSFSEKWVSTE